MEGLGYRINKSFPISLDLLATRGQAARLDTEPHYAPWDLCMMLEHNINKSLDAEYSSNSIKQNFYWKAKSRNWSIYTPYFTVPSAHCHVVLYVQPV